MLELKFLTNGAGAVLSRSWSYFVIEESSRAGAGAVAYLCLLQSPGRTPSLIKPTQSSIFKEFYLKKSVHTMVPSSV